MRSAVLAFLLLVSTACVRPGALPRPGRYIGEDVVAILSADANERFTYRIELSRILAGSASETLTITIDPKSVKENCGIGFAGPEKLELCWSTEELHVKRGNPEAPFAALDLKRSNALPERTSGGGEYTLDELLGRAKYSNYTVAEEAERVFQSKQAMTVALGNLLPHLGTKDVLDYAMNGPMGILGMVGDFLPFLFPSNWFQWHESKDLYRSERYSFASLRGNEMISVELLTFSVLRDKAVLQILSQQLDWLTKAKDLIESREAFGLLPLGSTDRWNVEVVNLGQGIQDLRSLIAMELPELSHAVALSPASESLNPLPVILPDLDHAMQWDPNSYVEEAKNRSFELRAMDAMIAAAKDSTKERVYGFLDPSSMMNPLGFGYAASIRIGKSQVRELEVKKREMLSRIETQSAEVAVEFNQALAAYRLAESGRASAQKLFDRAMLELSSGKILLGEPEFLGNLSMTVRDLAMFEANRVSAFYLALAASAKQDRLLLRGFYNGLDAAIPGESKERKMP